MIKFLGVVFFIFVGLGITTAQDEDDIYNKAVAQYALEDFQGAIETFDSLLKHYPKKEEAIFYRMLCRFKLADFYGTRNDYNQYKGIMDGPIRKYFRTLYDTAYLADYLAKSFYKYDKLYPELGYRPKYTRKDSLRGALRPERTCFDVTFYNLYVQINPKKKVINGKNDISFLVTAPTQKIQIDLFDTYIISSIQWNNKNLSYTREYNALFIEFPEKLMQGTNQTISISYNGKPRIAPKPPWDPGFTWDKDKEKNYWCSVSCEHLGASSWWPCKDHLSDEPDSMQMTFSVPEGYDLISNGTMRRKVNRDNGYSDVTWFVANPINTYNATFYMGKYSHFSDTLTNTAGKYPLDYYVLPKNLIRAKTHFAQTKKIVATFEGLFGDFPFMNDGFALVESPYQGMEHQGAIAYGNDYDTPSREQEYVSKKEDMIIVHESAHEWWGNSLTVKDMADIWIQEGFATYAEFLYFEKQYGYTEYLKEIGNSMNQIFNFWPLIQNYDVNENGFASNDCYRKGSAVLQSLRSTINNDPLFFKLIKDFALRYKHKTVTSSDFEKMVNEYTGEDYSAFFNKYLRDKDLPVLEYTYTKKDTTVEFSFRWIGVEKGFRMPFCISDGNRNYRFEGNTQTQSVTLSNARTLRFYTPYLSPEKSDKNSLTLFWTKKVTGPQK